MYVEAVMHDCTLVAESFAEVAHKKMFMCITITPESASFSFRAVCESSCSHIQAALAKV